MGAALSLPTPPQTFVVSVNTLVAQNILLARIARDWTQQELADRAGVSRATVAQLEGGSGDPRLTTLELLAEAFVIATPILLFGPTEIDAIAQSASPLAVGRSAERFSQSQLGSLRNLVASNRPSNRLEAARIGISAVYDAGFRHPAALIGAAIASYRRPGPATFALAILAQTLAVAGRG